MDSFVVVVVQPSCEEEPGDVSLPPGDAPDALVKDMVTFLQDRVASWGLNDCHGNAWEQKSKTA